MGPGGQLFARLDQVTEGGETLRLGHAIMDLRFAAGGMESQPVVPGETITAMMEFEAFDVVVPAGATLRLSISNTGEDYLPSAVSDPVVVETGAGSQLLLPIIERGPDVFFTPPPWASEAEA
jgi:predicted acyl esterase